MGGVALNGKEIRIIALLGLDTVFFLIEIIVGYSVHSLALIADSFHMLNDIFSLIIALWAVRVSKNAKPDAIYTYGWKRAEILGALVNAVFLIALCVSILIEAIQRFFEPQEIGNPKLILGVGTAGLVSNLIGLALFHGDGHGHSHGHSHGGFSESASHGHGDIEQGLHDDHHASGHGHSHDEETAHQHADSGLTAATNNNNDPSRSQSPSYQTRSETTSITGSETIHELLPSTIVSKYDNQIVSPILSPVDRSHQRHGNSKNLGTDNENAPLLANKQHGNTYSSGVNADQVTSKLNNENLHSSENKSDHGHSHSHGSKTGKAAKKQKSMNMHGVWLHVLGDALGNVGVILSGLFIWKTDYSWRFYADPVVSLVITVIIFGSALPLAMKASKILLQATPSTVSADLVKEEILQIEGVISVHDFHIWNLTESFYIASLHVEIGKNPDDFIKIAKIIRNIFHRYGIHSATVQPEFVDEDISHENCLAFSRIAGGVASQQSLENLNTQYKNGLAVNTNANGSNGTTTSDVVAATNNKKKKTTEYGNNTLDTHCLIDEASNCNASACLPK
ncbi:hypothetical protein ACO0QE_003350 [Hanseniaspora vineae]